MLKALNVGRQFGTKYYSWQNSRRKGGGDVADDVDELRGPSKKILYRIKVMLIGETEKPQEDDLESGFISEKNSAVSSADAGEENIRDEN